MFPEEESENSDKLKRVDQHPVPGEGPWQAGRSSAGLSGALLPVCFSFSGIVAAFARPVSGQRVSYCGARARFTVSSTICVFAYLSYTVSHSYKL